VSERPERRWVESLYAGSAAHYPIGRVAYPPGVADALRRELGLDGHGRLLDVGCGPGPLALVLAADFEQVVGVDADASMLAEAARQAAIRGVGNVQWVHLQAEHLPAGLGEFRLVGFAQSFHWMQRDRVAATARSMLEPGGAVVVVHASTHRGLSEAGGAGLPHPQPPWDAIDELVVQYLGEGRRPSESHRRHPGHERQQEASEQAVMSGAGFGAAMRLTVPHADDVLERTEDELVSSVFSLSSATPYLFGDRLPAFEADLRRLLRTASHDGRFSERFREISLAVYRPIG